MSFEKRAKKIHEKAHGKITIKATIKPSTKTLKLLYTPGVAVISKLIAHDKKLADKYTGKANRVAIVSDGSRVLGLGNVGADAALPVMESKALLYKVYGDVDAFPLCLKTQDAREIIKIVKAVSPDFGAVNIEDIESPKCFEIVEKLSNALDIPVFHDDQHGTAIVALAATINALKLARKKLGTAKIVVMGAGAAGFGITRLLHEAGARNLYVLDSKGLIYAGRTGLNAYKKQLAKISNKKKQKGQLAETIKGADVFIGVSGRANSLYPGMITSMNKKPIVFALTNPNPEIKPKEARRAGAFIIATGRSDFENQVNNALVFPLLIRKMLDAKTKRVTQKLLLDTALKLSRVCKPRVGKILPHIGEIKRL